MSGSQNPFYNPQNLYQGQNNQANYNPNSGYPVYPHQNFPFQNPIPNNIYSQPQPENQNQWSNQTPNYQPQIQPSQTQNSYQPQQNLGEQSSYPTKNGRSKFLTQEELLEQYTPKVFYKQIPVATAQARDRIRAFESKIAGTPFHPSAPTSGIVPVRIFTKKKLEPAKELELKDYSVKLENELKKSQKTSSKPKSRPEAKQILSTANIYTKDFAGGKNKPTSQKELNSLPLKSKKQKAKSKKTNRLVKFVSSVAILFAVLGGAGYYTLSQRLLPENLANLSSLNRAVAGAVSYEGSDVENFESYKKWILEKNGNTYSIPNNDLDNDQLTNYEEFLLATEPKNANTCSPDKTDIENLLQLVDPVSCKTIDMNNQTLVASYSKVINLPNIQKQLLNSIGEDISIAESSNLLQLFGVDDYSKINTLTQDQLTKEIDQKNLKIEYLQTIKKIDSYIEKYRSYKTGDRDYPTPVSGAVYLDVSFRYNTPLKYMLAIARLESRFGTDRFLANGNLTRPAQYQNIYSIGLTETSSSGFNSWIEGVEAFGKRYTKFEKRGVPDCAKWKIYNPNGDYCTKVENLAKEIESFLQT